MFIQKSKILIVKYSSIFLILILISSGIVPLYGGIKPVFASDFVGLTTACVNGLLIDVNGGAAPGSSVTNIVWNWGDSTTTTGFFPESHHYSTTGSYTFTVTAHYNDGSSASSSQTVSVAPGNLIGCNGLTINAGSGGSVSYISSVGSGTVTASSSKQLYLAGGDDLTLTANPSNGNSFSSWSATGGITGTGNNAVPQTQTTDIVVSSMGQITSNFITSSSIPSPIFVNSYIADISGNPINNIDINQPYEIIAEIKNPDVLSPHSYTINLNESTVTNPNGAINWNFPEPLATILSLLGLPTQWDAQPECQISLSGTWIDLSGCNTSTTQTIGAGQTSNFIFTFANHWNWIPPWDWKYLASTLIWDFTTGVLPTNLAVLEGLALTSAQLETYANQLQGIGAFLSNEGFNFQISSGNTILGSGTVSLSVPLTSTKMLEYLGITIASAPAGLATFAGIDASLGCETGVLCVGAVFAFTYEALSVAAQNGLYIAATDPDPNYSQIVQPVEPTLHNGTQVIQLPAIKSLPQNMYSVIQTLAEVVEYQNATAISIARYSEAKAVGNQNYQNLQVQAATKYAAERDSLLTLLENQLSNTTLSLPTLNSSSIQQAKNYLSQNGLPPLERQIFSGLGISSTTSDVTNGMQMFNQTTIGPSSLVTGVQGLKTVLTNETNTIGKTSTSFLHPVVISLTSPSGSVGSRTIVTSSGFSAHFPIIITYDGKTISTIFSHVGHLSQQIVIPSSASGPHIVIASNAVHNATGSITFTVNPLISLNKNNGPIGTRVIVTGTGFASSSSVVIKYNNTDVTPRGLATDIAGYFYGTITVPSSLPVSNDVVATDAINNTNSQPFTVTPSISLNATSGLVGNHVTLSGSNFAPSSNVAISYDGTT
ncbi:MAG TPA: hypothetical protein VJ571_03785, partial [Candidatus Nitrosotalea sp.]|nr:hypothetical protein [Candidatus Nitrosotalea sp.]